MYLDVASSCVLYTQHNEWIITSVLLIAKQLVLGKRAGKASMASWLGMPLITVLLLLKLSLWVWPMPDHLLVPETHSKASLVYISIDLNAMKMYIDLTIRLSKKEKSLLMVWSIMKNTCPISWISRLNCIFQKDKA